MEIITIRSMLALLMLCCACSLLQAIQANDFAYCGVTENLVKVLDVEISPQPVVNGGPATFNMTGIPEGSSIIGGEWRILILNFFGIVISDIHPLCEHTTCPVEVGQEFTLSITKSYKWLEPGGYNLVMLITSGHEDLVCINSDLQVMDPAYSYIRKVSEI